MSIMGKPNLDATSYEYTSAIGADDRYFRALPRLLTEEVERNPGITEDRLIEKVCRTSKDYHLVYAVLQDVATRNRFDRSATAGIGGHRKVTYWPKGA